MDGFKIFANVLVGLSVVLGFMAIILFFIFYWTVLRKEVQRRNAEEKKWKRDAKTCDSITSSNASCDV
jgi:phosphotransferase system  glucose/maltose/N-acetylglucosamine-specific IIC component